MQLSDLQDILREHNQDHVLAFYDDLNEEQQAAFRQQLTDLEWEHLDQWIEEYVIAKPEFELPEDLEPAPFYPLEPKGDEQARFYEQAESRGWELLREGKVAAFTVAGGQGTRLGFDGPKGTFPVAPVSGKTLFQWFAETLLRYGESAECSIPWYIMTSPMNDAPTRAFFREHNFFGLNPDDVMFFPQGVLPAFSEDGKLLLAAKDSLAVAPDGHGGSLKALFRSGATEDMAKRGIAHISYFQVDNPLVSCVSPYFLGLHDLTGSEMSSRCLPKAEPREKIGVFCKSDDQLMVVEYSDLPDELAEETDRDGELRYRAGSPAIHILRREFVDRLNSAGSFQLPFHRAEKKIPHLNEQGELVEPSEPNGVKLETFVFDALPLAKDPIVVEARREDEFGPVKNASGVDSVETSRELMQERFARWLAGRGIELPRDADGKLTCELEISPRRAVRPADLAEIDLSGFDFSPGKATHIA